MGYVSRSRFEAADRIIITARDSHRRVVIRIRAAGRRASKGAVNVRILRAGVVYHRNGIWGDYDLATEDEEMKLLRE